MFERCGEWSGYKITKSKTGFVFSAWSNIQGGMDGRKYLYKFDEDFTPETDLEKNWNDSMTYGEYLAGTIHEHYEGNAPNVKLLARGHIVQ